MNSHGLLNRKNFLALYLKTSLEGKTFGIHFPLGVKDMGMPVMNRGGKEDPEKLEKMFAELQKEMEILGPGKEESVRMSVIVAETQGINVKVGNSTGYLVYELKVPLTQNKQHPYAIGTDTSKSINIGFETPELDREMMGGRKMPEPFKLRASVKLASGLSVPK